MTIKTYILSLLVFLLTACNISVQKTTEVPTISSVQVSTISEVILIQQEPTKTVVPSCEVTGNLFIRNLPDPNSQSVGFYPKGHIVEYFYSAYYEETQWVRTRDGWINKSWCK